MRYRIKMMSKDELYITENEYQRLVSSKAEGLVFIESLKGTINLRSVETILPEDQVPQKDVVEGRLHDGTRVVKQFGIWKDATNQDVTLDSGYYPEIASDTVMSENDYKLFSTRRAQLFLEKPESVRDCKICKGTGRVTRASVTKTWQDIDEDCECIKKEINSVLTKN